MKRAIMLIFFAGIFLHAPAQILKKLKDKANEAVNKAEDKLLNGGGAKPAETKSPETAKPTAEEGKPKDLKVYSKFDFVPGSSILYFDNFEKDNIGEAPLGWITSRSAEVVTIEGLEGKWLKMASTSARHLVRNKKQSWGNNFTIEFDILIVKNGYDPRLGLMLINTAGKMVSDEAILSDLKPALVFESIIAAANKSRASLYGKDERLLSDNMTEDLPYSNTIPVHISMCVQGKRFRMWWNERKIYDMSAINETYLPNQFGFTFGSIEGNEFYVSNIRVAKDIPDTRAKFEQGKIISNLLFYSGTSNLKPESMGSLLDISKVLNEATAPVKVVGHTDSDGEDALNLKLSKERAEAVKDILVKQFGVDGSKMTTEGRGETQPVADNKNAEGKAQNRRVEFIFKAEADVYTKPAGVSASAAPPAPAPAAKPAPGSASQSVASQSAAKSGAEVPAGASLVKLESKVLTVNLPYANIMKTSDSRYVFMASKEEGNSKENFLKIEFETAGLGLKPETFNFKEVNAKNPLANSKKFPEIKKTEAVLYYGNATKPYIYQFSPIIAEGHMANYFTATLENKLPAVGNKTKFVIEKLEDGKASGFFIMGLMNEGLKPMTRGDAMTQTFTNGFIGEMKCTFSNVPVS